MKAIGYRQPLPVSDETALVDLELPAPDPRPRDLRVAVKAVSVNPVDVKQRSKAAPPAGEARVLGFDAAGIVEAVGSEVTGFKPGDEVYYAGAIDRPGSNSALQLVDERIVAHKPKSLTFAEAAALPLTSLTAWELLFDRLGVEFGRKTEAGSLLIINGAGGVGSILTQLAHRLTGLTVITTASRPETIAWSREMGADHVIDHRKPLDEELARIGFPEVDYIASLTATDRHFPAIAKAIRPQGRIALIDDPEIFDIVPLKRKSVSVHWELMFTRSLYQTPDMGEQHRILKSVAELVDAGLVRTTMTEDLGPITAASLLEAHRHLESGRGMGKTVLSGFSGDQS
ncbi:zinc-binding alcohol dehydrogenase family protein [Pelagibius sp. 7325]|uniref:zinc-binding alcohol dehydrogenase family protein n=2 Tax=Pseudomonadati TaxID=3379134 RepID=UPI0030EE45F8